MSSTSGAITAGNSKTNCIDPGGGAGWTTGLAAAQAATGATYNCIETFTNADPAWSDWTNPWVTNSFGYAQWLAAAPTSRTIILTQQLIPDSVCTSVCANPLTWEQACDSGAYNTYATQLATELVSTGFGNSVIRLGAEMNGSWENDYAGSTAQEQQDWAKCFAQEVTAMRAVSGSHLLFDWNVNACVENDLLSNLYPGNAYVDIVGVDSYDAFCNGTTPTPSAVTFASLASETDGLNVVTAFAKAQGKPMSLPEWGNVDTPANGGSGLGDDPFYIQGIANWVATNNVAFQSYFDPNDDSIIPLSSDYPLTLAAYSKAFG